MADPKRYTIEPVPVNDLRLDPNNPRFISETFRNEEEIVGYLAEAADLDELLLSILTSGYLDFEPIVVRAGDMTVLEGNRRVAALKLIRDQELRRNLNVRLPSEPTSDALPDAISAVFVDSAEEARHFIGFKHINGPRKWDAISKAKYASDWFESGASLEEISKHLGDTFNTVHRLVHGYRVYQQALQEGFDPDKRSSRRFAFSHLYTAITRASIRDWLELTEDSAGSPVPTANTDKLLNLMSWLYGQGEKEPALIRSQNPDLNRLANIMAQERPRQVLLETRDFSAAWEELEPPKARLEAALVQAVRQTEISASLASSFDGRETVFELGQRLYKSARSVFLTFRDQRDKDTGLEDIS